MKVGIAEIEQELGGEYATIVTLGDGRRFKCLRIEWLNNGLKEVDVRPNGAVVFVDPSSGESVTVVPIWLEGDPRGAPAG